MWNRTSIQELQQALRIILQDRHRTETVYPDGIYGPETAKAVRILQEMENLPSSGEIDQNTWNAAMRRRNEILARQKIQPLYIFPNPRFQLQAGAGGLLVGLVQGLLQQLSEVYGNLPCPNITMQYDSLTEQAVSVLQQHTGLPSNGILDLYTWNRLAELFHHTFLAIEQGCDDKNSLLWQNT